LRYESLIVLKMDQRQHWKLSKLSKKYSGKKPLHTKKYHSAMKGG